MAISPDERAFFVQLSAQIAQRRKAQGITQIQMAEALNAARRQNYNSKLSALANCHAQSSSLSPT